MAGTIEWLRRRVAAAAAMPAESWVTLVLVVGSMAFVFAQMRPALLFLDTTPAGGDMGAHVWAPTYLHDELLPRWRLSGWTPDWYAGFPAYQFYMVVPSLLIVLLDVAFFLPYNVAFKLVTVSGLVALPLAAYALGRLARLPFPVPAALAVATVPFVFERSFTIYGGNAASTLAGEFAFTISLVFALLFLGVVLRGMDTGRHRALAGVLLALTVLCHLIPAVFALVGAATALVMALEWNVTTRVAAAVLAAVAVVLAAVYSVAGALAAVALLVVLVGAATAAWVADAGGVRQRLEPGDDGRHAWWLLGGIVAGGLMTSFWTVPFVLRHAYLNDMGWEKLTRYAELLFPGRIGDALVSGPTTVTGDLTWVIALALVGAGTSLAFHRRFGTWLTITAGLLAVLVVVAPQGRLWNARILPFWYLCLFFLAALALVEVVSAVAVLVGRSPEVPDRSALVAGPVVLALLTVAVVAFPLRVLPFGHTSAATGEYSWFGIHTKDNSFIPGWARWNYSGYERKEAYPEYRQIVDTMGRVADRHGCGRAMWEYDKTLDRFGTPMALMLLPYWTDGCVGSMEGLYFEASATTPYHFLNQSELSAAPSRAQRDLPYGSLDVALGVEHLQLLGVKYYLAFTDAAVAQADADDDLTEVASIPEGTTTGAAEWHVYEIADADLVEALPNQPAVVTDVAEGGKAWQDMAVSWYLDRSRWGVMQAVDGPSGWQRITQTARADERPTRAAKVSRIRTDEDTIRFHVDRPGTPVLVKASYFPNWEAHGADGPYRVAPNLMVVVPTDEDVSIEFGRTSVDWLGILLTLAGIALAVLLGRRRVEIEPRPAEALSTVPPPPDDSEDRDDLALVGAGPTDGAGDEWAPPPG